MSTLLQVSPSFNQLMQDRIKAFGIVSCLFLAFCSEISTSLTVVAIILLLSSFLLSGDWSDKWQKSKDPIIKASLFLLVWLLIGALYSHAPADAFKALGKYSKLLLIWCLAYFLSIKSSNVKRVIKLLVGAALINLFLIYLNYYVLAESHAIRFSSDVWPSPKGHFEYGFFMTLSSLSLLLFAIYSKNKRLGKRVSLILGILGFYSVFFLNTSKTGYIMASSVILLALSLRYRLKGLVLGLLICALILASSFRYASHFRTAAEQTLREVQSFSITSSHELSAELRLYWLKTSLEIIKDNPLRAIAGFGTGSLKKVSSIHQEKIKDKNHLPIENPHNQFLLLLLENGVIGVLLFAWLLTQILLTVKAFELPVKILGFCMVLCMIEGCIFNSWLKDLAPACLFAIYTALILCKKKSERYS